MNEGRRITGYLLGLTLALANLAPSAIAQATSPKGNGKIAFGVFRQLLGHGSTGISVMNPDGSGRAQLTFAQITCPPPNRLRGTAVG